MKTILLVVTAMVPLLAQSDTAAARVPIESYLKGHATGQAEHIRAAFHPGAHIQGIRQDGKFVDWTLEEYAAGFKGVVNPEEPQRKRWIEKVEVTGNAGIATVRFDYPKVKITDYFVLLKREGQWRIANKVFSSENKP